MGVNRLVEDPHIGSIHIETVNYNSILCKLFCNHLSFVQTIIFTQQEYIMIHCLSNETGHRESNKRQCSIFRMTQHNSY